MKIIIKIVIIIILLLLTLVAVVYYNPQLAVGLIQKGLYGDEPINSFSPVNESSTNTRDDGSIYINDIEYGTEYPNSFLDITYTSNTKIEERPTIIYLHGGGFFGGSKTMGDPLAVGNSYNYVNETIVAEGHNLVSIDYALVPDYHFPVPLIQLNEAMGYLYDNQEELNIDMDNVILFGQSAGAIMTTQYATLLKNEEYAEVLNIEPTVEPNIINSVVIDDAIIDLNSMHFNMSLLINNYIDTTSKKNIVAQQYQPIEYIDDFYDSFMIVSNDEDFYDNMSLLKERLDGINVEYEFFYRDKTFGDIVHGFINNAEQGGISEECFNQLLNFLDGR